MSDSDRSAVRRRRVLRQTAVAGGLAIAGCLHDETDADTADPDGGQRFPVVEDRPDAVYLPTHREAMRPLDPVIVGEYGFTPAVTYPHRFWTVTGRAAERVDPGTHDNVHLMVVPWDSETGTVLPVDAGLRLETRRDGTVVDERTPWPMLSQEMGFHVGDNLPLEADGTYRVEGRVGPLDVRTTGAFAGRFDDPASFAFEFTFDRDLRDLVLDAEYLDEEQWGDPGALEPAHDADATTAHPALPQVDALPGTLLGTPAIGDAVYATTVLEPGSRFVDGDERYLAVSPRTPYNRYALPLQTLQVTVGGETDSLAATVDPDLGYHYGVSLPDSVDGEELTLDVRTPPQVARHQGYETAFRESATTTLSP